MMRSNRGEALLLTVVYLFFAILIVVVGLYANRIQAEKYQQEAKENAITLEKANEGMQLQLSEKDLQISKEQVINVSTTNGGTQNVKFTPITVTSKKSKTEIKLNNSTTDIDLIDNPIMTKYNHLTSVTSKSSYLTQVVAFHDPDGPAEVNKKALIDGATDISGYFMEVDGVSEAPSKVKVIINHPQKSSLLATDVSLPEKPKMVKVYVNNQLKDSQSFNSDTAINFSSKLTILNDKDLITYEYYNANSKLVAISNIIVGSETKKMASVYDSGAKLTEEVQLVLNQAKSFYVENPNNIKSNGIDNIKNNMALYPNLKVNYYTELVCQYREVLTPISYVKRADSSNLFPYTGTSASSYSNDNWIPSKKDFNDFFGRKASTGFLDYNGDDASVSKKVSPCAEPSLSRSVAYDGKFFWYNPQKKYLSFINGFTTIKPDFIARFEGSKINNSTSYKDSSSASGYNKTKDKYNFIHDSSITNIPAKSKLYCSDYLIKEQNSTSTSAPLAYPHIKNENQKWWDTRSDEYEAYLKQELATFNSTVESIQWANGVAGNPINQGVPIWNSDGSKDFDAWMVKKGHYTKSNGEYISNTGVPCVNDTNRNQVHIQYKPRLDNYTELNYNIINNIDSEYTVTLTGKLGHDYIKELEEMKDAENFYKKSVDSHFQTGKDSNLNNYTFLTEKEAVKDWLEEFTTQRARVYIESNKELLHTGGDNTVKTEKGYYMELSPQEDSLEKMIDPTTREIKITYKFHLGANFDNPSLAFLSEDIKNSDKHIQVRFYAYLGNTFLNNFSIENETVDKAYYKMSVLDSTGKPLREEFVEVGD